MLQYSCLENPMDGGAWWAAVHGVAGSRTRLSDFTFTFHFHALEKEMATHSRVLAWRIPGTGEPGGLLSMGSPLQCSCLENPRNGGAWWAAIYGVAQSRTRLKRLGSSRITCTICSGVQSLESSLVHCIWDTRTSFMESINGLLSPLNSVTRKKPLCPSCLPKCLNSHLACSFCIYVQSMECFRRKT